MHDDMARHKCHAQLPATTSFSVLIPAYRIFARHKRKLPDMLALMTVLNSLLVCRLRRRAALELEVIALRHQLAVLRRQRPGRPKLTSMDRLLWVCLTGYGRAV